nr:RecName: Full=Alpha-2-antiplasmin; Short=Alpha-2-AP; AltName: Full=Alpha-2-plasmin inhibitor; Short=Alpha-2-PI; AltName: Full=Serpin F2 [Struthio camelus]
LQVDYLVLEVA